MRLMAELLSADEVQRIGLGFIQDKYYRGKATVNETKLVAEGDFPVYHLVGTIKMQSRSIVGRLIFSEAPFTFSIRVHALEGSIVSYELR